MTQGRDNTLEQPIKSKLEEELATISSDIRGVTKTAKEVASLIMPRMANIITVVGATALSTVVKDVADKILRSSNEAQKYCLLNRYENDRLEQYMRRNNLDIIGLAEEEEEILQAKTIEVAADMGVAVEPGDISMVHRLGKPGERSRPVIVRFCHIKKRNAVMMKKKEI